MKLIYLEWEDACSDTGWKYESDLDEWADKEHTIIKSTGWLLKDTKRYIVLAAKINSWKDYQAEYGFLQKIPKTWIRKRKDLTKYI